MFVAGEQSRVGGRPGAAAQWWYDHVLKPWNAPEPGSPETWDHVDREGRYYTKVMGLNYSYGRGIVNMLLGKSPRESNGPMEEYAMWRDTGGVVRAGFNCVNVQGVGAAPNSDVPPDAPSSDQTHPPKVQDLGVDRDEGMTADVPVQPSDAHIPDAPADASDGPMDGGAPDVASDATADQGSPDASLPPDAGADAPPDAPICVPEICNGFDDDCDGDVDEEIPDEFSGTDEGICQQGWQICTDGDWAILQDEIPPEESEVCNGLDDNCDGDVDEGFASIPETCNGTDDNCNGEIDDGIPDVISGTDVGSCQVGILRCEDGEPTLIQPEIGPAPEVIDGEDNDCDDTTDLDSFSSANVGVVNNVGAVTNDGGVYVWGYGASGVLGSSIFPSGFSALPVLRTGLVDGAFQLDLGQDFAGVVLDDGSLWTWGLNSNGSNGIGIIGGGPFLDPAPVSTLDSVELFVAGVAHACAVSGGNLYCWGRNDYGQVGDGTTIDRESPTLIPGLIGVQRLALGEDHTIAATDDTVYGWGRNNYTKLCRDDPASVLEPTAILGVGSVDDISVGVRHSLFLGGGVVRSCGRNNRGQLGIPTDTTFSSSPVVVEGLFDVVQIGSGVNHNVALQSDGNSLSWGDNSYGQLCLGVRDDELHSEPAMIDLEGADRAFAGGNNSAFLVDGVLFLCGGNALGQNGNGGDALNNPSPTPIVLP